MPTPQEIKEYFEISYKHVSSDNDLAAKEGQCWVVVSEMILHPKINLTNYLKLR